MKKATTQALMSAAVLGIIGASTLISPSQALAGEKAEKGHCVGANACSGKGGCATPGKNECAGKNGCKGKGFLEKTKAECDKLAKKNKDIHFEKAEKHEG